MKKVFDVEYFLHWFNEDNEMNLMVVSLATHISEYKASMRNLRIAVETHGEEVSNELEMITDTIVLAPTMGTLKLKIEMLETSHYVSSVDEIFKILKTCKKTFGVWGKEQLEFFSTQLDNVVDVSDSLLDEVLKMKNVPRSMKKLNFTQPSIRNYEDEHQGKMNDPTNIGRLFLLILHWHIKRFLNLPKNSIRKNFKDWVENHAWIDFMEGY